MSSSLLTLIIPSAVVLASVVLALWCWVRIVPHTSGTGRTAAQCFVVCFALYSIGQALALLQMLNYVQAYYSLPPVCYAIAAVIFGLGSWQQLKYYR